MLRQGLKGGRVYGFRLYAGNQVNQCLCLCGGHNRADGDLAAFHRRIDDAVLLKGFEQVI